MALGELHFYSQPPTPAFSEPAELHHGGLWIPNPLTTIDTPGSSHPATPNATVGAAKLHEDKAISDAIATVMSMPTPKRRSANSSLEMLGIRDLHHYSPPPSCTHSETAVSPDGNIRPPSSPLGMDGADPSGSITVDVTAEELDKKATISALERGITPGLSRYYDVNGLCVQFATMSCAISVTVKKIWPKSVLGESLPTLISINDTAPYHFSIGESSAGRVFAIGKSTGDPESGKFCCFYWSLSALPNIYIKCESNAMQSEPTAAWVVIQYTTPPTAMENPALGSFHNRLVGGMVNGVGALCIECDVAGIDNTIASLKVEPELKIKRTQSDNFSHEANKQAAVRKDKAKGKGKCKGKGKQKSEASSSQPCLPTSEYSWVSTWLCVRSEYGRQS